MKDSPLVEVSRHSERLPAFRRANGLADTLALFFHLLARRRRRRNSAGEGRDDNEGRCLRLFAEADTGRCSAAKARAGETSRTLTFTFTPASCVVPPSPPRSHSFVSLRLSLFSGTDSFAEKVEKKRETNLFHPGAQATFTGESKPSKSDEDKRPVEILKKKKRTFPLSSCSKEKKKWTC